MLDLGYWLDTFLSRPDEVAALALTVAVFGAVSMRYPDRRDRTAVGVGASGLVGTLAFVGAPLVGEWHYWLLGGALLAAAVVVVDGERR